MTSTNYQVVGGEDHGLEDTQMVHLPSSEEEEKCCRICLEEDDALHTTMIAPCKCKGSSKWVHRECLDLWRTNEQARAFSQCTECLYPYHIMTPPEHEHSSPSRWRRAKFCMLVSRDVCLGTVLFQLVIVALGYGTYLCDPNTAIVQAFRGSSSCEGDCHYGTAGVYYVCGFLIMLVLLGCFGSIVLSVNKCSIQNSIPNYVVDPEDGATFRASTAPSPETSTMYRNHRRRYHHHRESNCCDCCIYQPIYMDSGNDSLCCCCYSGHHHGNHSNADCDCSGCHHSGVRIGSDDDCAHVMLVILAVVAVVMAVIGFVVGIVIAVVACQRVIQRHIYLLHKRQLVKEFTVMNLSGYNMDDLTSLPPTTAPLGIPPPSAPPMHQADEIYLQKLDLLA
jgi:hypothetical protein